MIPIFPIAEGISIQAQPVFQSVPWFTNSMLVTIIVAVIILVLCRRAGSTRLQNRGLYRFAAILKQEQ